MSDKINLKALERKAYLIYHEDGLLDIGIGAVRARGGLLSVGYSTEVRRFTNYGIAAVTLHVLNHFVAVNQTWDIWQGMAPVNLLLGLVMLGNGYMFLNRFKKKYPLIGDHLDE